MKTFLLLFFSFTSFLLSSELKYISTASQDFAIAIETYDIYNSKGEVMKLYKKENNDELTFVLSHVLEDSTGPCTIKRIERGAYDINDSHITLYSLWDRRGNIPNAPYGVRIQQYEILDNHEIIKKSSYIYIESESKNYDLDSGMQYLFTSPKTDQEKEKLRTYIKEVEKRFKGVFVYGDDAKMLIKEVQEALKRKMASRWERE